MMHVDRIELPKLLTVFFNSATNEIDAPLGLSRQTLIRLKFYSGRVEARTPGCVYEGAEAGTNVQYPTPGRMQLKLFQFLRIHSSQSSALHSKPRLPLRITVVDAGELL